MPLLPGVLYSEVARAVFDAPSTRKRQQQSLAELRGIEAGGVGGGEGVETVLTEDSVDPPFAVVEICFALEKRRGERGEPEIRDSRLGIIGDGTGSDAQVADVGKKLLGVRKAGRTRSAYRE